MPLRPDLPEPIREEWEALVAAGFCPNGSTWSPDRIYGLLIGNTSPDYEWSSLPANLHDARYSGLGDVTRDEADAEFLWGLRRLIQQLPWYWRPLAQVRVQAYFVAVRVLGSVRWRLGVPEVS